MFRLPASAMIAFTIAARLAFLWLQALNERAVNLQNVQREAMQVAER